MSLNSLVNFGVPGQGGQRSPILQPTFSNRFRCVFYNFGQSGDNAPYELTRAVQSVTRPELEFDNDSVYSYLSQVKLATRPKWGDITMKFYEDIDNEVAERVLQQLAKQQNMFDQTASRAGQNYKFELDIDILAGGATAGNTSTDPNVIQKISIVGGFLTKSSLSELTYTDAKFGEIEIHIAYDNATFFDENGNRMGTFSHTQEINGRQGSIVTGTGAASLIG